MAAVARCIPGAARRNGRQVARRWDQSLPNALAQRRCLEQRVNIELPGLADLEAEGAIETQLLLRWQERVWVWVT
jgi:hypothetical protein